MTDQVLIEVAYGEYKAIVPTFHSLPYEDTEQIVEAFMTNNQDFDAFNRSLELFCKNLAPEKMEELRNYSVDDIVCILDLWIERSANAHRP